MKRPLIPFFLLCFLITISKGLLVKLCWMIIGFFFCKISYRKIYLIFLFLVILRSFFPIDQGYSNLELNGQVKVYQRGYQNYFVLKGYRIFIKSDELLVAGIYDLKSQHYQFTKLNPNAFNYQRYLLSKGYVDLVDQAHLTPVNIKENFQYKLYAYLRKQLERTYGSYAPLLKTMIIGDKSDFEIDDFFSVNGTVHILAISGLHVGILYWLLKKLDALLNTRFLSLLILFAYILLIGYPISAVRALLMLILHRVAVKTKRPYDMISALMAIGIFLFFLNPYAMYDIGLHYSFTAVLAIGSIYKYLRPLKFDFLVLPLSIQIGLLPLTVYYSHKIHLLSFFVNLLVIPLVSLILSLGLLSLLIPLGLMVNFNIFLCDLLYDLNMTFAQMESFIIELAAPSVLVILLVTMHMLLVFELSYRKMIIRSSVAFLVLLSLYALFAVEVYFFDVGQGDGALIKDGLNAYVIDGGKPSDNAYFRQLLLSNGVLNVDYAFVSHSDSDHIGGIVDAKDLIRRIIYQSPNDLHRNFEALRDHTKLHMTGPIKLGSVTFSPISYQVTSGNNASLVFTAEIYNKTILFTGDIEECVERQIISQPVDIIKVPHHGSKTSSTKAFVDQCKADVAIISVGYNSYGHPHEEVIKKYEKYGQVYMTRKGCIKIIFLPFGYFIRPYDISNFD